MVVIYFRTRLPYLTDSSTVSRINFRSLLPTIETSDLLVLYDRQITSIDTPGQRKISSLTAVYTLVISTLLSPSLSTRCAYTTVCEIKLDSAIYFHNFQVV